VSLDRRDLLRGLLVAPLAAFVPKPRDDGAGRLPFVSANLEHQSHPELAMFARVERNGADVTALDWEWVDERAGVAARWDRETDGVVVEQGDFRIALRDDAPPDIVALYNLLRESA
jgi:hypothetical protein